MIKEHPVLLNRAPTLHRLGIQAFEPTLTEGKAIQLHPLVCTAFNADFDGDQMAVHVPLSIEAQVESRVLMMSTNNILSPANGKPIIVPSQDMILGLYYMTMENSDKDEKPKLISSDSELEYALFSKAISLHSKIKYRYKVRNENNERYYKTVETTPGRVILYNTLPEYLKENFDLVNKPMTKGTITNLIDVVYRNSGQKETVMFCDRVMALGFKYASASGISIGKDDMVIPATKQSNIDSSMDKIKKFAQQYHGGLITSGERYNKIIDEWTHCTDKTSKEMMAAISDYKRPVEANSIYMMADSGARGSENQIKQLAGMRGLMAKPSGEIIETPITSNFKEGLSVLEYFISAHGARKGLADTALKTANSGYLTRRLVDVSQDCIVQEYDCKTTEGINLEGVVDDGRVIVSIGEQILGRVLLEDVKSLNGKSIIAKAGQVVDEDLSEAIENAGIKSVRARSILTCNTDNGVCARCYGRDLATGDLVSIGEAVGVVAAQSIGEPGTQLTMRTFHIGGAAQRGAEQSSISAISDGVLRISDKGTITNRDNKSVIINRDTDITILDDNQNEIHSYRLPYGAVITHKNGDKVKKGDHLAEWDPYAIPVIAETAGTVQYSDLAENVSLREKIDESTGVSAKIVMDWKQYSKQELKPRIGILNSKKDVQKEYPLFVNAIINVSNGDEVKAGDVIAKIQKESSKNRDITGGLPRVADLFEARKPKNAAVMSDIDGRIEFGKDYKVKRKVIIRPENEDEEAVEYMIAKSKHLFVSEGDFVRKGDILVDGSLVPHDILRILGIEEFTKYMVDEVQKVYRMQGVRIDDKHIEVILSRMLKRVEVKSPGDTTLLIGEPVDKDIFDKINNEAIANKRKPAKAIPILLGITKASLQTKSFISAASFQETTKVLTDASVQGKYDDLIGLKENIIVGRLIPAGTGLIMNQFKAQASKQRKAENKNLAQQSDVAAEEKNLSAEEAKG